MKYNQKIVRSANNYYEIWEYEKPILITDKFEDDFKDINKNDKKEKTIRRTFDELSDEEQNERLRRMSETRLKAKWKILRLVDTNFDNRTSFLTLTTKENIQDRSEFTKMFDLFITRLNYSLYNTKKRKIKYLATLERQKRLAWHAHLLFFDIEFIPHKDLLNIWGHGAVRINKLNHLNDSSNAGRYVVKYMEKSIGQSLLESFGKKSYLASRNLKKPEENKIFLKEKLEFDDSLVLYETEYKSKIYRDGRLIDNPVKYRKIKIAEEEFESSEN